MEDPEMESLRDFEIREDMITALGHGIMSTLLMTALLDRLLRKGVLAREDLCEMLDMGQGVLDRSIPPDAREDMLRIRRECVDFIRSVRALGR